MARYTHEDLICPDGHRTRKLVADDEPLPTCEAVIAWDAFRSLGEAAPAPTMSTATCGKFLMLAEYVKLVDDTRYVQVFKPFTYEGVHYADAAQWQRHKEAVAANLMVPVSQLVEMSPDRHADRVRADEAAHRGYMGRRRAGHDEVSYRDYVKEERRKSGKDERIVVGYRGPR